jgi:hypothetical protein
MLIDCSLWRRFPAIRGSKILGVYFNAGLKGYPSRSCVCSGKAVEKRSIDPDRFDLGGLLFIAYLDQFA